MPFKKSQFVFYAGLAFIIGVGLASFFPWPWLIVYAVFVLGLALLLLARSKSRLSLTALCLLFFACGLARYQISIPVINENHLAFYNNQANAPLGQMTSLTFRGLIDDEPDVRKDHVKYQVKGLDKRGNVLVKAPLFPPYQYGDVLEITCQLQQPEPIVAEPGQGGGKDFQYDKYLALSDIYSLCYRGRIKLIEAGQGNLFKSSILKIKDKVVAVAGQILPEPQASFLGGLLWGAKKGLPEEVLDNFSRTGVTHIIAVSGYNITIIAVMLTNLFIGLGLSRKNAFWLIIFGIVFFVVITGSPASIVRAGIMGTIALLAQTFGRATRMRNILVIVCLIMLLFNPKVLIWDAGFQLSFLATIGLIYFVPILKKYMMWLPKIFTIRESLTTTLSAIVLTTPLILFQFGRFSLLAPLANLLILPVIPVNMAVGFLAVVGGLIWQPIGQVTGWVSWVILTYVLKLTEVLAALQWALLPIPNLHWVFMVGGYLIIGWLIYKHEKNH